MKVNPTWYYISKSQAKMYVSFLLIHIFQIVLISQIAYKMSKRYVLNDREL